MSAPKRKLVLYNCKRCKHLATGYYEDQRFCEMTYLNPNPPQTVYADEDGNLRCKHYDKKY